MEYGIKVLPRNFSVGKFVSLYIREILGLADQDDRPEISLDKLKEEAARCLVLYMDMPENAVRCLDQLIYRALSSKKGFSNSPLKFMKRTEFGKKRNYIKLRRDYTEEDIVVLSSQVLAKYRLPLEARVRSLSQEAA